VFVRLLLQAEPRAQLSLASRSASQNLKISPQDLILYSAKVGVAEGHAILRCYMLRLLCYVLVSGSRVMARHAVLRLCSAKGGSAEAHDMLRLPVECSCNCHCLSVQPQG
jgi:hypothetical protein